MTLINATFELISRIGIYRGHLKVVENFKFSVLNFLSIEAGHVQAHGQWKLAKRPKIKASLRS
jgi:hypothetical protein